MMRTYHAKPQDIQRTWFVVDAENMNLGRLATRLARILQGKHKAIYTPSEDTGDVVIVINGGKVALTGDKANKKMFYHTGHPGGIKEPTYADMLKRSPRRVLELAVRRMLPKGPLGRRMMSKLKVYAENKHPHEAQQPQVLIIER